MYALAMRKEIRIRLSIWSKKPRIGKRQRGQGTLVQTSQQNRGSSLHWFCTQLTRCPMETLAALAAQVQNLATRLHELEEKLDRVSGQTRDARIDWNPDTGMFIAKETSAELSRLAAQMHDLERGMVP